MLSGPPIRVHLFPDVSEWSWGPRSRLASALRTSLSCVLAGGPHAAPHSLVAVEGPTGTTVVVADRAQGERGHNRPHPCFTASGTQACRLDGMVPVKVGL